MPEIEAQPQQDQKKEEIEAEIIQTLRVITDFPEFQKEYYRLIHQYPSMNELIHGIFERKLPNFIKTIQQEVTDTLRVEKDEAKFYAEYQRLMTKYPLFKVYITEVYNRLSSLKSLRSQRTSSSS